VELSSKETFAEPVYDYHPSGGGAILGGITYTGSGAKTDYPAEYRGAIFITDLITSQLQYLRLNEAGTAVEPGYPKVLAEEVMAVDWAPAPNGDLMYVDIGFGEENIAQIRRVSFDSENAPPEASISTDKAYGSLPLKVKFDASKSSDPNGNELSYAWDFDEDGKTDSTSKKPERTFEKSVNTNVTLTVEDGKGGEDTKSIEIFAGDAHAPEPTFDSGPTTYEDGEPIAIAGSATDQDQGPLGNAGLFWNVKLNHAGTHIHPITEKGGIGSVQFTTDTAHDAPSFYEVELTATDSRGLATTIMRNLTPVTKLVRIDSSPEGAPITYGGVAQTAPYEKQSTIGLNTTLSTAPSFSQSGSEYEFESWSDGGLRIHDLVVPNHDVSLTASYRKAGAGGGGGGGGSGNEIDEAAPHLAFSAGKGLSGGRRQSLRGTADDPSGVDKVQVALRQTRKPGGRCRWWSQKKGAFPKGTASCARPAYMAAQLKGGGGRFSWSLPLNGHLPKGRYLLFFRTEDGAGNVGAGPDGSKPVSLVVK
jgi:PKD repeat protein